MGVDPTPDLVEQQHRVAVKVAPVRVGESRDEPQPVVRVRVRVRAQPGVSRYAARTAYPRLARVRRAYSAWGPGASCPAPQVRTARRRRVRVSPYAQYGARDVRTCQHSRQAVPRLAGPGPRGLLQTCRWRARKPPSHRRRRSDRRRMSAAPRAGSGACRLGSLGCGAARAAS